MTVFSLIGLMGVVTVILAYGLMTAGKIAAQSKPYQWLNVAGTACILISLIEQWNLPAFVANMAWIAIGFYSLYKLYTQKRAA